MIRVYLDAASPVTKAGLEALLREQPEIELSVSALEADVVVKAGLDGDDSSLPLVILTDETGLREALRAGARAALPFTAAPAQIVAAIQAVAAGLGAIPAAELTALVPASPTNPPAEPLTPREIEVLEMLAEGLSNKVLAYRLSISTHTAKFHVNAILAKLGASTRTEAVTKAIRLGLIQI